MTEREDMPPAARYMAGRRYRLFWRDRETPAYLGTILRWGAEGVWLADVDWLGYDAGSGCPAARYAKQVFAPWPAVARLTLEPRSTGDDE
jgi:hypothetical protein